MIEERNIVIHSAWRFGNNTAFTELYATTVRPRTKQGKGAVIEVCGISAQYLQQLTERSTALQVKLHRLESAILQKGCKVEVELKNRFDKQQNMRDIPRYRYCSNINPVVLLCGNLMANTHLYSILVTRADLKAGPKANFCVEVNAPDDQTVKRSAEAQFPRYKANNGAARVSGT